MQTSTITRPATRTRAKVTIDEAIEAMPDAQPVTLAYGGEDWTLELEQADADLLDASVDSAITRL